MSRLAAATLSLSLFAAHAFGAEAPAQTPLADPRCTVEGLTALKEAREKDTGRTYTDVQISRGDNGQPTVSFMTEARGASVTAPDTLCSLSGRTAPRQPAAQQHLSI